MPFPFGCVYTLKEEVEAIIQLIIAIQIFSSELVGQIGEKVFFDLTIDLIINFTA